MTVVTIVNSKNEKRSYTLDHLIPIHRETAERILAEQPWLTYTQLMKRTHEALLGDTYVFDYYREWQR